MLKLMVIRPLALRLFFAAVVLVCVLVVGAVAWAGEPAQASVPVTVLPGVTLDITSISLPGAILLGLMWLGQQMKALTAAFEKKDLNGLVQVQVQVQAATDPAWDGQDRRRAAQRDAR